MPAPEPEALIVAALYRSHVLSHMPGADACILSDATPSTCNLHLEGDPFCFYCRRPPVYLGRMNAAGILRPPRALSAYQKFVQDVTPHIRVFPTRFGAAAGLSCCILVGCCPMVSVGLGYCSEASASRSLSHEKHMR